MVASGGGGGGSKLRQSGHIGFLGGEASRPTYAVVPQLPEDYRADLSGPEQIAERLKAWDAQEGGTV